MHDDVGVAEGRLQVVVADVGGVPLDVVVGRAGARSRRATDHADHLLHLGPAPQLGEQRRPDVAGGPGDDDAHDAVLPGRPPRHLSSCVTSGQGGAVDVAGGLQRVLRVPRSTAILVQTVWIAGLVLAASTGGVAVIGLLMFVFTDLSDELVGSTAVVVTSATYAGAAALVGLLVGLFLQRRTFGWRVRGREPSEAEARRSLRLPAQLAGVVLAAWLLGAGVVGLTTLVAVDAPTGVRVVLTVALGGLATAGITYLLCERASRDVVVEALQVTGASSSGLGVSARLGLTWALTSAVPATGVVLVVVLDTDGETSTSGVVFLASTSVLLGALGTALLARGVGSPLRRLRGAVQRIGEGDADVQVDVDDASEIGMLQDAVNLMTENLRERERVQDLFGRHVGESVARHALEQGVTLEGEVRHVVALFVDVVDSTALATRVSPDDLVPRLNAFFAAVVDAVDAEDGLLNKFEGDAALCVFGAPVEVDDTAGRALRAARAIRDAVAEGSDLEVGVGVAGGQAFAGQVGAEDRLEYTVIGDPVNTAARLTDLAKDVPGRVAVAGDVVGACSGDERRRWRHHDDVTLRGRDEPTELWVDAGN